MNIRELSKEQLAEESMINIAFAILSEKREPLTLNELMNEIRQLTGVSEAVMKERLVQFYTDMNIDGRFLAINDGRWGLREWYPVEQIEEETAPVVKVRKKKKKKAEYDEDEELEEEEEEEDELFDEDYDELLDEEDEDEDEDDEEEEDEEIVEIEADLIDADDDLEIIDDEDIDIDDEEEEEEEEL